MAATSGSQDYTYDRALVLSAARLGIPSFKEEQEKAISSFISGWQTCFVSLPTGYGKSACFGCLPVTVYEECQSV